MSADGQGYNGWTNYETWCVNLWLSNDEGTYEDVMALAREHSGIEAWRLGDALHEYVKALAADITNVDERSASMVDDLICHALVRVDWREIADGFAAEVFEGAF